MTAAPTPTPPGTTGGGWAAGPTTSDPTEDPLTSSGLPTARHHFPSGTDGALCINWNRVLKAARIVLKAIQLGYGENASEGQVDEAADAAGANRPGSEETYRAVYAGLTDPLTDDEPGQAFAQAVMDAGNQGHPFQYTNHEGHTVLLVPIPVAESAR